MEMAQLIAAARDASEVANSDGGNPEEHEAAAEAWRKVEQAACDGPGSPALPTQGQRAHPTCSRLAAVLGRSGSRHAEIV
jgi:hypothetical protein